MTTRGIKKQEACNNERTKNYPFLEWWVWISWWFWFSVTYSRLYRVNPVQAKQLIGKKKRKNFEKAPSLEVVLVQCNFVGNQYQQKSEILYTYTHNKSYAYLLNDVPSNLVFLKTYNAELDDIILTFIDHRPFEIEEKANVTLFINKQKWHVTLSN